MVEESLKKLPSAEEQRKRQEETLKKYGDRELQEITELLINAQRGTAKEIKVHNLSEENLKKLGQAGYKVSVDQTSYNGAKSIYIISW